MTEVKGLRAFIPFTSYESGRELLFNKEFIDSFDFYDDHTLVYLNKINEPVKVRETREFIMSHMMIMERLSKWDRHTFFMAGVGFVFLMQHLIDWAAK